MGNPDGVTNVFDREWDLCIILDACRYDLMQEGAPEYEFIENIDSIYSVGPTSREWMDTTFSRLYADKIRKTAVVTGNPFSDTHLDADTLEYLDEVWKYAWDDDIGTVPARPITNRAITYGREKSPHRLVVHYMQPHFPCVPRPRPSSGVEFKQFGTRPMPIWEKLSEGKLTTEEVWAAALRNLQYVLDDVGILLENIEAERVVITADHGDAYGENDEYGHQPGSVIDVVRKVPWVVTTANDDRTHEPVEYKTEGNHVGQNKALHALGYQ